MACKNHMRTDKFCNKDELASAMMRQKMFDNLQNEVRLFEERWRKSISNLTTSIELFKYKKNNSANSKVGINNADEQTTVWDHIIKPVSKVSKNNLNFYIIEDTLPSTVQLPPTVVLKQLGEKLRVQLLKITEMKNRKLQSKLQQSQLEQSKNHTIAEIKHSIIKYYKAKYDNLIEYNKANKNFLKQRIGLDCKDRYKDYDLVTLYDRSSQQNVPTNKKHQSKISPTRKSVTSRSKNMDADVKAADKEKPKVLFTSNEPAERDVQTKKKQVRRRKKCDTNNMLMIPLEIINKINDNHKPVLQNDFEDANLVKRSNKTNKHHAKVQVKKNCHRNCLVQVKDIFNKHINKKPLQLNGCVGENYQSTINKSDAQCSVEVLEKSTKNSHHNKERQKSEVKKKPGKQNQSHKLEDHKKKEKRLVNQDRWKRKANDEMNQMFLSPYMSQADKRTFFTKHSARHHKTVAKQKPVNGTTDLHSRLVNELYSEYSHTKKLVLEDDEHKTENENQHKETARKSLYQQNQHLKNNAAQKPSTLTNKRVYYVQLQNQDQEFDNSHRTSKNTIDSKDIDRKLGGLYRSVDALIFRNNNISNFDLNNVMNNHKLGKPVWLDPDPRPNGFGPLKPRLHATYQKAMKRRTVLQEFVLFLGDPNANLYSIGCL